MAHSGDDATGESKSIVSPIPGKVFKILVKEGEEVRKGDVVVVIDAMKMENNITTRQSGVVKKIHVRLNEMVEVNTALVEVE
ncbi:MAG: acetyl-CoA carboxylase biotin carboxyl carrier protein subunit [Bacteroidales bacterium]